MKGDNHTLALNDLVSFPVQVCKATDDGGDVKIDNAAPSGAPIKLRYTDEATGETFDYGDRLRGVKVGDEFKQIPADSLKAIDEQTKVKTMKALGSLPLKTAREKYGDRVNGRYFLQVPAKSGSATAYRLTYEALLKDKAALVTKRTPRSRQQLGYIYADKDLGCLVYVTLAFADCIREPDEQVKIALTAKVEAKQVDMARQIIGALPDGVEALDTESDEAVPLRRELVEKAVAGESIEAPTPVAQTTATEDLTAALEASLAAA
jgi:non-homologous end joining protein Ku